MSKPKFKKLTPRQKLRQAYETIEALQIQRDSARTLWESFCEYLLSHDDFDRIVRDRYYDEAYMEGYNQGKEDATAEIRDSI